MTLLQILAVTFQLLDGLATCHLLSRGFVEKSPMYLVPTCKGILVQKAVITAPVFVLRDGKHKTVWTVGLIGTGAIGFSVNISGGLR